MGQVYGKISINKVIPDVMDVLEQNTTILQYSQDVSKFYTKGTDSVSFLDFSSGEIEDIAFTADFEDEDPQTTKETMNMTNKLGGTFSLNDHVEFQNVVNSEELAIRARLKKIGVGASNKLLAAQIAGAHADNNVVKNAPGATDLMSDYIIAQKLKLEVQGISEQLYYAPTSTDLAALQKELKNTIRFDVDKSGVIGEYMGVKILKIVDVPSAILTHSTLFSPKATAHCWGDVRFKRLMGEKGDRIVLDRPYNCKVLKAGKLISKLMPYVAP